MIIMPKTYRNAIMRVSQNNILTKDNEALGLKAGDTMTYTLEDIINILDEWSKKKKIKYFVIEHNSDPDNVHFHIMIMFSQDSICTFETLKNKFPYGDIEGCKYGVKNCVQYLVHMNNPEKHQYSWDAVVTNAPDKLEDFKIPGKAAMNAKLKNILNKILSGEIRQCELDKIDFEIYNKYKRQIERAFEYRYLLLVNNPNRKIKVVVLQGPPRVGKSTFCKEYAKKNNKSICFSSSSNDPWQEYAGQDIFVYDDFNYCRNKIEDMLKALDPHNLTTVSARYRNKLFIGDTIFICTNSDIVDWYSWASDEHRNALFSRIACVLDFKDSVDGVARYTVNNIVDTGEYDYTLDALGRPEHKYRIVSLVSRDNKVYEFDLKKYIDIHEDANTVDEVIEQFKEL